MARFTLAGLLGLSSLSRAQRQQTASPRPRGFRPSLEGLEDRFLLTAGPALTTGGGPPVVTTTQTTSGPSTVIQINTQQGTGAPATANGYLTGTATVAAPVKLHY